MSKKRETYSTVFTSGKKVSLRFSFIKRRFPRKPRLPIKPRSFQRIVRSSEISKNTHKYITRIQIINNGQKSIFSVVYVKMSAPQNQEKPKAISITRLELKLDNVEEFKKTSFHQHV